MTETAVVAAEPRDYAQLAAEVVVKGDLSKLTNEERMAYYTALCNSLGLNPLTRPFEFITLNGKLTLYAKRDAADQIRTNAGVTVTKIDKELIGDIYVVTAYGRTPGGREDASTGAVAIRGLAGENLANAYMKAETKAKRRLTLSLIGLGFPTEEEVEDIHQPEPEAPRPKLAEIVRQKAAEVASVAPEPSEAATEDISEIVVEWPEPTPGRHPRTGLTAAEFATLAREQFKGRAVIAKTIGCKTDEVHERVEAMSDVERGVLADELEVPWREPVA